jgi:hypothetical protein
MRQAISTKYLGATNSRGSRIKALGRKAGSLGAEMSLTVPWDHALGIDANHAAAAKALAVKLGWYGMYFAGGAPDESGNVYVCVADAFNALPWPVPVMQGEGADWFIVPVATA